MTELRVACALALIALAACDNTHAVIHDSNAGLAACKAWARRYETHSVLRAEFDSSGPALVKWESTRNGPMGPNAVNDFTRRHSNDAHVYVCYFDGQYAAPFAAPAAPATPDRSTPNRERVLVLASGDGAQDTIGYHDTPGHGRGQGELDLLRPTGMNP